MNQETKLERNEQIRKLYAKNRYNMPTLAKMFNLSKQRIHAIIRKKTPDEKLKELADLI